MLSLNQTDWNQWLKNVYCQFWTLVLRQNSVTLSFWIEQRYLNSTQALGTVVQQVETECSKLVNDRTPVNDKVTVHMYDIVFVHLTTSQLCRTHVIQLHWTVRYIMATLSYTCTTTLSYTCTVIYLSYTFKECTTKLNDTCMTKL